MSKRSEKKKEQYEKEIEAALKDAVRVSNEVDLKTAIGQKALAIISNDEVL